MKYLETKGAYSYLINELLERGCEIVNKNQVYYEYRVTTFDCGCKIYTADSLFNTHKELIIPCEKHTHLKKYNTGQLILV